MHREILSRQTSYFSTIEETNALLEQHIGNRSVVFLTTKWWHQQLFDTVMTLPPAIEGRSTYFPVQDETSVTLGKSIEEFKTCSKNASRAGSI